MDGFFGFGRLLIFLGIFLIILGSLFLFGSKIPYLGRLPGDIYIRRGNFTFYFPLTTSLIVSLLLTLLFSLIGRR